MKKLTVIPEPSRREGEAPVVYMNGVLGLFSKQTPLPAVGHPVDAIITGAAFPRDSNGNMQFDWPRFVFLQPMTEDHLVVEHEGFVTSGSRCQTLATCRLPMDGKMYVLTLTPGRTQVYNADRVNDAWQLSHGHTLDEVLPGVCVLQKEAVMSRLKTAHRVEGRDGQPVYFVPGTFRCEGLLEVATMDFWVRSARRAVA